MQFLKREPDAQQRFSMALGGNRDGEGLVLSLLLLAVLFFTVDRAVVLWIKYVHQTRPPLYSFLNVAIPVIGFVGHGLTLIISSLVLFVGGRYISERVCTLGRTLFISLLSAGVIVQIVKHLVGRARPRLSDTFLFIGPSFRSGYDSFPSGHTTLAFCMAYILSRYFPSYRLIFYLFALAVGFQRIGDISHFPSDVFAGAVIGTFVAKLLFVKIGGPERTAECQQ